MYALVCEYVLHVCVRSKVGVVALTLSVYVHGRAVQMCDIGCCVCVCVVKQVIGAVKGVGSKKDIQRSKQRGMKVKT